MSKYEPLARHLATLPSDTWNARFAEVEKVLGFDLPQSAFRHRAWWANQNGANHSQTEGWRAAGWETREIDFSRRTVRFERARRRGPQGAVSGGSGGANPDEPKADELAKLWVKAREITGIQDHDQLLEAALTSLIRREAARQLSAMGGTMPDFTVPPRERPTW